MCDCNYGYSIYKNASDWDQFEVTFRNGNSSTMTRKALENTYLYNEINKDTVESYVLTYCAI